MMGYLIEMYSKNNEINNGELLSVDDLKAHAVKANKSEQMKKIFKSHRGAFDFDTNFCHIKVAFDDERMEEEEKEKELKKSKKFIKKETIKLKNE